jgi:NAD+ diphosphatase
LVVSDPDQPVGGDGAEWIVARDRELLVSMTDPASLPRARPAMDLRAVQHLGELSGTPIVAASTAADADAPSGWRWVGLRSLFGVLDDDRFSLAGRAVQLLDWELNNAYCGRCGTSTNLDRKERCSRCPRCDLRAYPRIEPAVIVAVTRAREILLAGFSRLPGGMHSVLAGFVEPGETLEQCVTREVFEETGIHVKNPQYWGSQPWPFPRSLMLGFVAEYASGELNIDPVELESAAWFSLDELPLLPSSLSIARALIDFVKSRDRNPNL